MEKLKTHILNSDYYSAHQTALSLHSRFLKNGEKSAANRLLLDCFRFMVDGSQGMSAFDLGSRYITAIDQNYQDEDISEFFTSLKKMISIDKGLSLNLCSQLFKKEAIVSSTSKEFIETVCVGILLFFLDDSITWFDISDILLESSDVDMFCNPILVDIIEKTPDLKYEIIFSIIIHHLSKHNFLLATTFLKYILQNLFKNETRDDQCPDHFSYIKCELLNFAQLLIALASRKTFSDLFYDDIKRHYSKYFTVYSRSALKKFEKTYARHTISNGQNNNNSMMQMLSSLLSGKD